MPRFSSIKWGLCLPSACSPKDVEIGILHGLNDVVKYTGLRVQVRVEPGMCHKGNREIPFWTIVAMYVSFVIEFFNHISNLSDAFLPVSF